MVHGHYGILPRLFCLPCFARFRKKRYKERGSFLARRLRGQEKGEMAEDFGSLRSIGKPQRHSVSGPPRWPLRVECSRGKAASSSSTLLAALWRSCLTATRLGLRRTAELHQANWTIAVKPVRSGCPTYRALFYIAARGHKRFCRFFCKSTILEPCRRPYRDS